jgi:hypothetical protein
MQDTSCSWWQGPHQQDSAWLGTAMQATTHMDVFSPKYRLTLPLRQKSTRFQGASSNNVSKQEREGEGPRSQQPVRAMDAQMGFVPRENTRPQPSLPQLIPGFHIVVREPLLNSKNKNTTMDTAMAAAKRCYAPQRDNVQLQVHCRQPRCIHDGPTGSATQQHPVASHTMHSNRARTTRPLSMVETGVCAARCSFASSLSSSLASSALSNRGGPCTVMRRMMSFRVSLGENAAGEKSTGNGEQPQCCHCVPASKPKGKVRGPGQTTSRSTATDSTAPVTTPEWVVNVRNMRRFSK